jgi:DNA-binding winged helix-turn-helix (wHTH) protein
MQRHGIIRFGSFELDTDTRELRKRGRRVRLSPKPAQALALLASAPGRLITREAIRKELWDSDMHVDFEHALNFCIREVRAALGDNAKKPRYIETLPRRGYRFIAETSVKSPDTTQLVARPEAARQLEAYKHYESARKSFGQAGKEALENARQGFELAVEILPEYALAHSGLGASYALRSLNRRDPEDLNAAEAHLSRALELDPELAEPYPWLCYVLMRSNRWEAAIQAGHRGVELQPDLVTAHYFLGLAYFAGAEIDVARYENSARHLRDAIGVNPHWQASWYVLSYLSLLVGEYREAEYYAESLLEMNRAPKGLPFIGAEIVLGSARLREADHVGARTVLLSFLERISGSDHMYRDAMTAAAACVLGEVELRHGEPSAALAAYRRGWHTVQEYPRVNAYDRIAARAQAGLAAAYAAQGDRARAEALLERATGAARQSESMEHNAAAAAICEVYWTIASAWMRLGDDSRALEALVSAVRTGARDPAWLQCDPEFASIRGVPAFGRLVDAVRPPAAAVSS